MLHLLAKWVLTALALILAAYFVPGVMVTSFAIALVVAALMGLANIFIRPVLFLLTLPITILTLGLFTFVINGLLFWFIAWFVDGFDVSGFLAALLGAIVVSIFSWCGDIVLGKIEERN